MAKISDFYSSFTNEWATFWYQKHLLYLFNCWDITEKLQIQILLSTTTLMTSQLLNPQTNDTLINHKLEILLGVRPLLIQVCG